MFVFSCACFVYMLDCCWSYSGTSDKGHSNLSIDDQHFPGPKCSLSYIANTLLTAKDFLYRTKWLVPKCGGGTVQHYNNYKVCDLIGHFVLASQGLLGRCTFVMS